MFHVLVVGLGTMGGVHSQAYAGMDNAKLVGVVDINEEKATELATKFGAKAFVSLEQALASLERVDIVDICLPTPLHKPYVMQAADAGKHIICEKPMARSLGDAEDMIGYCREKGVKLFIGHVLRFFPEYVLAKKLVDEQSAGTIAVARTTRGGRFPRAWNNWYADFDSSGGLTLDMLIHDIDFLRWCFGEVERVYAKGTLGRGLEDLEYALVTLRFRSGTIAHLEGTWAHDAFSMKFELAGTTGVIDYDSAKDKPMMAFSRAAGEGAAGVAVPESPLKDNPYALELKHFLACIERDEAPLVSTEDAYEAMRIALAAIESMQTGKPVTLELFPATV